MRVISTLSSGFVVLILCSYATYAQTVVAPPDGNPVGNFRYITGLDRFNNPVEYPVQGTPYASDEFAKAFLYTTQGSFTAELRYNIFRDWMEYRVGDTVFAIRPDTLILAIDIGDKRYLVDVLDGMDGVQPAFLLQLDTGKLSLMAKMNVGFTDRQQGRAIQGDIPAKYTRLSDTYYFRLDGGPLQRFRSVRQIIEVLPEAREKLAAFVREEKISPGKPDELIRLFRFINTIL